MTLPNKYWPLCLFLVFSYCQGCAEPISRSNPANSAQPHQAKPIEGQKELATPNDPTELGGSTPKELRNAWRSFIHDARYRLATAGDFRFSEKAIRELRRNNSIDFLRRPYLYRRIHPGGYYPDLAVIVVDTWETGSERFGLIIFNSPEDESGSYKPFWLYKGRDLSKTFLGVWSGGVTVRQYNDEGEFELCHISWDKERETYACTESLKNNVNSLHHKNELSVSIKKKA